MEVNLVSAEFALRESLRKENSPLENLGKVHHTVKWQKNYFITFGLILQKASFDPKILKKNQPRHVFFKMTGSAISGLAVTMSAADTRFTSIANIARENYYGNNSSPTSLLELRRRSSPKSVLEIIERIVDDI